MSGRKRVHTVLTDRTLFAAQFGITFSGLKLLGLAVELGGEVPRIRGAGNVTAMLARRGMVTETSTAGGQRQITEAGRALVARAVAAGWRGPA